MTGFSGFSEATASAYHQDQFGITPTLSATIARILCSQTPAHAYAAHPRLNPDYQRQDDEKFDIGNAVHSLLLEGDDKAFVIHADSWRTKDAKESRDEARAHGKVPLLVGQYESVLAMLEAVRAQIALLDVAPAPFTAGKPEQTLTWEENGVACRARVDWLHDDHTAIDDLKTTSRSADPDQWGRTMFNSGYDVQAAMYARGVKALTGSEPEFRFVIAETQPPFLVSVVALAPDAVALANSKLDYALTVWARCLKAGRWEGWPNRVCYAEAPGWAEGQWLEREAREDVAA
jgi:hypothetical protein